MSNYFAFEIATVIVAENRERATSCYFEKFPDLLLMSLRYGYTVYWTKGKVRFMRVIVLVFEVRLEVMLTV